MPRPKTATTHCHAQLGLPDNGPAIKELVVYRTFDHKVMHTYTQDLPQRSAKIRTPVVYPVLEGYPRLHTLHSSND